MAKVFVDQLMNHGWILRGRPTKNCHMFVASPDDLPELHKIAQEIGMKRSWFQDGRTPHYDLTESRRNKALALGAYEVNMRKAVAIWREFRKIKGERA